MALDLFSTLDAVKSISLRDVPGDGCQVDLTINTKRGSMTIRLLARQPIRVVDLRQRDKAKRRRGLSVPMEAVRP